MFTHIERPTERPPVPLKILSDFGFLYVSSGFIGWLFAVTAPVAIILAVGSGGGLSEGEIASWIFGVFFINGLLTILFCWLYQQPLAFFWTIPGTVLMGQSLTHLTFPQVVGAYYVTSVLMLHHLPRSARDACAREVQRVLKPGGRVLAVDYGWSARNRSIIDRLHGVGGVASRDIVDLLSGAGLDVRESGPAGMMNPWISTSLPLYDLIFWVSSNSALIASTSWANVSLGGSSA